MRQFWSNCRNSLQFNSFNSFYFFCFFLIDWWTSEGTWLISGCESFTRWLIKGVKRGKEVRAPFFTLPPCLPHPLSHLGTLLASPLLATTHCSPHPLIHLASLPCLAPLLTLPLAYLTPCLPHPLTHLSLLLALPPCLTCPLACLAPLLALLSCSPHPLACLIPLAHFPPPFALGPSLVLRGMNQCKELRVIFYTMFLGPQYLWPRNWVSKG